jgi:ubiquinone/menaquinone biosynthesis C-methylase UbiE
MTIQKDSERNEVRYLHRYADFGGKRVLEIGCGDGRLTWRYADAARYVAGIDLNRDDLRIASIERGSDFEKTVALAQADSIRLPFRDDAFDLAILAWTF